MAAFELIPLLPTSELVRSVVWHLNGLGVVVVVKPQETCKLAEHAHDCPLLVDRASGNDCLNILSAEQLPIARTGLLKLLNHPGRKLLKLRDGAKLTRRHGDVLRDRLPGFGRDPAKLDLE